MPLMPNHVYLIPPRVNLEYYCNTSFEVIWFHAVFTVFGSIDLFDLSETQMYRAVDDMPSERALFQTVVRNAKSTHLSSQLSAKGAALQLVAPFLTAKAEMDRGLANILPALDYIEAQYQTSISLDTLARLCGYERTYFSACFKRATGETPIQFIHRRRIDEARGRLTQTNDKLEAIAYDLGYTDAFHFSKTFKKVTGISPSTYRKIGLTPTP